MALGALALTAAALLACPLAASAGSRTHAPGAAGASASAAQAQRVLDYWTPQRRRQARSLDLVVDSSGRSRLRVGAAPVEAGAGAAASFVPVASPDAAPYAVNGRVYLRRGRLEAVCSGTAIDTPTRQLVLTAGHCVNSGPEDGHRAVWSSYLEFVPAYTGGTAPFGTFVAQGRATTFAPKQWTKHGNPDFDLGAFLVKPNGAGVNLADAVGGGATIVTGLPRAQKFSSFGYPGETRRMQSCQSKYLGDDSLTYRFSGPPTLAIGCRWAPGASGGGWLIGDGTQINGLTSYLHLGDKKRTYGPYFAEETVGKLVRGL